MGCASGANDYHSRSCCYYRLGRLSGKFLRRADGDCYARQGVRIRFSRAIAPLDAAESSSLAIM
jgi:hypothetical protein